MVKRVHMHMRLVECRCDDPPWEEDSPEEDLGTLIGPEQRWLEFCVIMLVVAVATASFVGFCWWYAGR